MTEKLDRNITTTNYNAPSVGSLLAVAIWIIRSCGIFALSAGNAQGRNWFGQGKNPVSVARYAYDGVEVLGGKIYFAWAGNNGSLKILLKDMIL